MATATSIEDAFFKYEQKGDKGIYLFWSTDWATKEPWTYDGEKISYFDKKFLDHDMGSMVTRFVGPLCVITYKMRKRNE